MKKKELTKEQATTKMTESSKAFCEALQELCEEHEVKGIFIGASAEVLIKGDEAAYGCAGIIRSVDLSELTRAQRSVFRKAFLEAKKDVMDAQKEPAMDDLAELLAKAFMGSFIKDGKEDCDCPRCKKEKKD